MMRIANPDGIAATSLKEMKERVKSHFQSLYSRLARPTPNIEATFPMTVSVELNAWLRAFPRMEEVQHDKICVTLDVSDGAR